MITGELPSKYHKKYKYFLQQRKTTAIVKEIFANMKMNILKLIVARQKIPLAIKPQESPSLSIA